MIEVENIEMRKWTLMKINNVLNSIISIEDYNGDEIMRFFVDENGNLEDRTINCDIADITDDYFDNTDRKVIRIQSDYLNYEGDEEDYDE